MINYQVILYDIVKKQGITDKSIESFRNIDTILSNNKIDIYEKVNQLQTYLNASNVNIKECRLAVNNDILNVINTMFQNEPFKSKTQQDVQNISDSAKTILGYIIDKQTVTVNVDELYTVENVDANVIKSYVQAMNTVIAQQNIYSILNFINKLNLQNMYKSYLLQNDYTQLTIPLLVYNALNDKDNINNTDCFRFKEVYEHIQSFTDSVNDNTDNEFLTYFSENVKKLDIQFTDIKGHELIDSFNAAEIMVDRNIFNSNNDKIRVSLFLSKVQSIDNITQDMYDNWNESLYTVINTLLQNNNSMNDTVSLIKNTLRKPVKILVDGNGKLKDYTIEKVIHDMTVDKQSIGYKALTGKADKKKQTVEECIIQDYKQVLKDDYNITDEVPNNFFQSLNDMLNKKDDKVMLRPFEWCKPENIKNAFNALYKLLLNEEVYTNMTLYYTIVYCKLIRSNTVN